MSHLCHPYSNDTVALALSLFYVGGILSEKSPEFDAVRNTYTTITSALQSIPDTKKKLLAKFKQDGWIAIDTDCSEEELVECALKKIELNPRNFNVFVTMLHNTVGMQDVAEKILEHL